MFWRFFQLGLIYQSFVLAKEMDESSVGRSSGTPSCLVIVLRSIIEEQINSDELDVEVKGFSFSNDIFEDKKSKLLVIYASAEQALSNFVNCTFRSRCTCSFAPQPHGNNCNVG